MFQRMRQVLLDELRYIEQLPEQPQSLSSDQLSQYRYPFSRSLQSYLRKLPDLAAYLKPDTQVLDIGTGSGAAASAIRQHYGCSVYGTGITPLADAPLPFCVCIAAALPFSDAAFDVVIGVQSLSWEPDQVSSLREISRVLRPGGRGFLIFNPFQYSIDHRFGKQFWEKLGVSREAYETIQFLPTMEFSGVIMTVELVPLQYPYGSYRDSYYIRIIKPTAEEA